MCDIFPMQVTYILLGRPWLFDQNVQHNRTENTYLFDQNVQHNGKENTYALMVGEKEVVLKPMTLAEMNKFKGLKPKVIEGKETEAKISVVETEAPKTTADQPIEVPQIPANLFKIALISL